MQGRLFVDGLRAVLIQSGFSVEEAGKYLFHGWRHFYTSYLMGKLERKLLKSQTGHLTDAMLSHYGEHRTEGDRQTIQATAIETFGKLLPYQKAAGGGGITSELLQNNRYKAGKIPAHYFHEIRLVIETITGVCQEGEISVHETDSIIHKELLSCFDYQDELWKKLYNLENGIDEVIENNEATTFAEESTFLFPMKN